MTVPNEYDTSACCSAVTRIARLPNVVSVTPYVTAMLKATYAKSVRRLLVGVVEVDSTHRRGVVMRRVPQRVDGVHRQPRGDDTAEPDDGGDHHVRALGGAGSQQITDAREARDAGEQDDGVGRPPARTPLLHKAFDAGGAHGGGDLPGPDQIDDRRCDPPSGRGVLPARRESDCETSRDADHAGDPDAHPYRTITGDGGNDHANN